MRRRRTISLTISAPCLPYHIFRPLYSPATPYTSSYLAMTTRRSRGCVSDSKTQEEGTIIIIIASRKSSELLRVVIITSLCAVPHNFPSRHSFRSKESLLLLVVSSYNDRHRGSWWRTFPSSSIYGNNKACGLVHCTWRGSGWWWATKERFAGTQYQSFGLVLWSLMVTASVQEEEEEFKNIYKNQNQKRKNPKRWWWWWGTLCGGVLSSGCPTASHTGEERPRSIKSGLQNNCCCAGLLFSNTHVAGPLEILSSSFITDHLKTREADLPALEETPRPTERRQSLLFPSAFTHKSEAMLDCLRMWGGGVGWIPVSIQFTPHTWSCHIGCVDIQTSAAGGRLLKTKTFVRCWRKQ